MKPTAMGQDETARAMTTPLTWISQIARLQVALQPQVRNDEPYAWEQLTSVPSRPSVIRELAHEVAPLDRPPGSGNRG